ncbi:MAG: HAD hydrolase-like protein [candidate division NC10 bacterium]|nr:HAD hydrolase-like protein [candidate division NC10 bacterium]
MVHLLLFDVDGTLIQTGGAGVRAFQRTFRELFGVEAATDRVRFHGRTDPEILDDLFAANLGRSPTGEEARAISNRYIHYLHEEVPRSPGYRVMPGLPGLLELLAHRAAVRIGLATGNLQEAARIKLSRADLNRFFAFGGFGSDAKDRTALIHTAIERGRRLVGGGGEKVQAIVIGDTDLDIACGRAAGAMTVAVATGCISWETLREASPDHLLKDLGRPDEFLAILDDATS